MKRRSSIAALMAKNIGVINGESVAYGGIGGSAKSAIGSGGMASTAAAALASWRGENISVAYLKRGVSGNGVCGKAAASSGCNGGSAKPWRPAASLQRNRRK